MRYFLRIVLLSYVFFSPLSSAHAGEIILRDVTRHSGVAFAFFQGARGRHDLPEIMGGGVALIDVDGDGRLDLYFCNGGPIASRDTDDPHCRLYRNRGEMHFEEITTQARVPGPSYAMGAAVGDFDNDGRDDLLVTGWRDQRLYRNVGGAFEDVTERAGLTSKLWSTSAAWADLDGDGDLDLYVATYLEFDPESAPYCAAPDGRRDYCGPEDFPAQPDRLYRNNGDGTFTDVSEAAGIQLPEGRGLGVLVVDLVGDSRPDLFVANDGTVCWLFENLGGLRFREVARAAGLAFDGAGQPIAGMGVAAADLNEDGRTDLVVGNLHGRGTVGFLNQARGVFHDASAPLGLTIATRDVTGFGLALVDLNADGRPDLIQANGHVLDRARLGVPFAMRPTLLQNEGGRFMEASRGQDWRARRCLGRGLAVGDLDDDGRPDVVIASLDAPPALLRNESDGRAIVLELIGKRAQPFGARVKVTAGGQARVYELAGGSSYLSASDRRIFLGPDPPERIEVTWPSGATEFWTNPRPPRIRLGEGTGSSLETAAGR